MAESLALQSDKETGYLTENFSRYDDFMSVDNPCSPSVKNDFDIIYGNAQNPSFDDLDFVDKVDGTAVEEENDVLDERNILRGLSKLGWSADGTEQAFLHLKLPGSGLRDISILSSFIHLQKVHIPHNEIEDLSSLGNMPFLIDLDASHNLIKVVLGFTPPRNLSNVDLSFNDIDEIPDLSCHQFLQRLILNSNNISEMKGLDHCFCLTELGLGHNQIKDIANLNNLLIKFLDLSYNELTAIENLETLGCLRRLSLGGNKIRSLDGLRNLPHLDYLDLEENEIIDLAEIENLTETKFLWSLNLLRNPVQQIPDYRLAVIYYAQQLAELDMKPVTIKDKIDAKNFFDPTAEYVGARDHMMHIVYSFLQPTRMLDITLPMLDAPYPMLVLVGPNGIGKKNLAQKLSEEFSDYFGYAASHTSRNPHPGEARPRDYSFVSKEEFECLIKLGTFLQTYSCQGELYGLSLEAVETVASEALATVTHMELEGVLTLKNSHLEPRYVLILPADDDKFERHLLSKGLYSETRIRSILARVNLYKNYNQQHPGFFDVTISSDDITETYSRLRAVVMQYLGLSVPSSDTYDSASSFTNSFSEFDYARIDVPGPRGMSAPTPKRTWSRPSLTFTARSKVDRSKTSSSVRELSAKGIVEEDSLRRRHSAAKDVLSGHLRFPLQQFMKSRSQTVAAGVGGMSHSQKDYRGFSAPVTEVNLEVVLPNTPDSSDPSIKSESTPSEMSSGDSSDHNSMPTTEPKRAANEPNLPFIVTVLSRSAQNSMPPVLKPSSKADSLPCDIFTVCSQPVRNLKADSERAIMLPPIDQRDF